MILECENCKKEFKRKESQIKRSKNHFCSKKCKDEFQKKQNIIILKETHAEILIKSLKYGLKTVLIDLDDVDKVKKFKWFLNFDKTINNFYIKAWERDKTDTTRKLIKLHRYLTNCPENLVVDHINRNTLDNRKCNLRCVTIIENNNNRSNIKNVKY